MLKIKPQNPKGVRDYLPIENAKREYIISVIRKHFELYGFNSIYNPVFERLETLQGKYGEEGDKLLFKILNSGDYLADVDVKLLLQQILRLELEMLVPTIMICVHSKKTIFKYESFSKEIMKVVKKAEVSNEVKDIAKTLFKSNEELFYKFNLFILKKQELLNQTEKATMLDRELKKELNLTIQEEIQKTNYQNEIKYITNYISEKGLRYDHTVPLARFVAQHQNKLTFPFKRFVIGPVWRADRPQKGRYQEFFQCDADIVGSKGLIGDVEMITLIDHVFNDLDLKVEIKINNRKIYNGICEQLGIEETHITFVSTVLDKWDKIGEEKVREELVVIIGQEKMAKLMAILEIKSIDEFKTENSQIREGIEELKFIFKHSKSENLKFDLKLLRGLDYYTGTVLEIISTEMVYGSIGGGGRYDNLTEIFGLKDMSGIGISFGLDRVYDVMTELKRFPKEGNRKKFLILNLTDKALDQYFSLLMEIRQAGNVIDLYPSISKMDKQLAYADKAEYTHAIIVGEDEFSKGEVQIKNLKERTQALYLKEDALKYI